MIIYFISILSPFLLIEITYYLLKLLNYIYLFKFLGFKTLESPNDQPADN